MPNVDPPPVTDEWTTKGFDPFLKQPSNPNPKPPNYQAGVHFDATLDEMVLNRMIQLKNLPYTPQGNAPGKMYWDIRIPTAYIWINNTVGWFDLLNRIYGSMYAYEISETITVSLANTWYEVTAGVTSGGYLKRMTFANAHELVVELAGIYQVNWSMALTTTTANDEVMGTFGINNTATNAGASHGTVKTGGAFVTVAGTGIVSLAANDAISMFVDNESAARNITIEHITCSVTFLGFS